MVPERVTLEMTNICGQSCEMCPRHHIDEPEGFIDFKNWKRVVNEMHRTEIPTLLVHWRGEALLHPDFVKMIKYARARVSNLEVSTGFNSWTEEHFSVLELLDFVGVSVHSIQCLDLARELLKRRGTRHGRPSIQLSVVECEDLVEETLEFSGKVDRIKVKAAHTIDGVWGKNAHTTPKSHGAPCPRLGRDIVIGWNGRPSRCCVVWETEPINVFESSIYEVFNRPDWKARRNIPAESDPICVECDQWGQWTKGDVKS